MLYLNLTRYVLLFIVFNLSARICAGQEREYVSPLEKEWILVEDFKSNQANWIGIDLESESGSAVIDGNNGCIITASPKRSMLVANEFPIDTGSDFEIDVQVQFLNSKLAGSSPFSISWGASFDNNYQFALSATPNGIVTVREINRQITSMLEPFNFSVPNQEVGNGITIRKLGRSYYFYINGFLVGTSPFKDFYGDGLFLTAGNNLSVKISSLKIAYIKKQETHNFPPRLALDKDVDENQLIETEDSDVLISGIASDEDGIRSLVINGLNVSCVDQKFEKKFPLVLGKNLMKIVVTDNTGLQTIRYLEIIREKPKANFIAGQRRLAIIIGNSSYEHAPILKNPANDARDIAQTFSQLGFTVKEYIDLGYDEMIKAIRDYGNSINDYDVTTFFFAGHGMQIDNKNYILPIDAECKEKNDVQFEAIEVEKILSLMQAFDTKSLHIMILDACRNNPFRSWSRGGPEGLAAIQPPSGTLIAYATSPGSFASDGNGENGLYTSELINQLMVSQRIEDVFINTRIEVEKKSHGQQSPWELARLRGIYYLK